MILVLWIFTYCLCATWSLINLKENILRYASKTLMDCGCIIQEEILRILTLMLDYGH